MKYCCVSWRLEWNIGLIFITEGTGFEITDQYSCSYFNTRIGKPSGDDEFVNSMLFLHLIRHIEYNYLHIQVYQ
jgi:hypothetical protein